MLEISYSNINTSLLLRIIIELGLVGETPRL
jgi:hypothetical protein